MNDRSGSSYDQKHARLRSWYTGSCKHFWRSCNILGQRKWGAKPLLPSCLSLDLQQLPWRAQIPNKNWAVVLSIWYFTRELMKPWSCRFCMLNAKFSYKYLPLLFRVCHLDGSEFLLICMCYETSERSKGVSQTLNSEHQEILTLYMPTYYMDSNLKFLFS